MAPIPVYLKTGADSPRPADPEFYWVTRDGPFLCRNHAFFQSDVPTRQSPRGLAPHAPACEVRYPPLRAALVERMVGFFGRVYELHQSESIVLLYWDLRNRRYRLWVPEQEATVWESSSGARTALDVRYTVPVVPSPHLLLVGDVHCHGDGGAYASSTDRHDERHRDGMHGIVGRIEDEPPDFALTLAVDGYRFPLRAGQFLAGYRRRRQRFPAAWLDRVKVRVERPSWRSRSWSSYSDYYSDDPRA